MRQSEAEQKRDVFFLALQGAGAIPWDGLPNRGVFAVYSEAPRPGIGPVRLFLATGVLELQKRIEEFQSKGMLKAQAYVETAPSERDLMDCDYEALIESVLRGIEAIKRRGDRATLRRVRAAMARKGEKPGPKVNPELNAWLIAVLKELATGRPLKQVTLPKPWKPASASAKLSRFCWDFYLFCTLLGAPSPQEWQREADLMREKFGFEFPRDIPAAQEAFWRGEKQVTPT